ncbi:MAG: hypothetical protein OES38_22180 [Gammaproteobacteria bacterium]|nr:hypothetical protein [Gammaproteobacteria bacterium]
MLTKADDYPIHQTPEPIAYSGTDRNFYDRYFFNGYHREGDLFFAAALGVYPHLNIMDAAFCAIVGGKQYNVHASKVLHMERLNTRVGPIEVEVIEPLQVLRVTCNDPDNGLEADVCFNARVPAIEEPRFLRRTGSMTSMDYTRLTQNGAYDGWLNVNGERFELDQTTIWGTRDRSWGIRGVGDRDTQVNPYAGDPQFFWLWAPLNFPSGASFYHLNADVTGKPWNTMGRTVRGDVAEEMAAVSSTLKYQPGSRIAAAANLDFTRETGEEITVRLTPQQTFYMRGLGYMHPEWGHGQHKGELATGFEVYDLANISPADPGYFHIQAICEAQMTGPNGTETGKGVLEQLVIGAYQPYGFKELFDVYP